MSRRETTPLLSVRRDVLEEEEGQDRNSISPSPSTKANILSSSYYKSSSLTSFWTASIIAIAFIVFTYTFTHSSNDLSTLPSTPTPPMSIVYDKDGDIYRVIDNFPLYTLASSSPHVLANGSYVRNVNGNGWNYLTILTGDLQAYVDVHRKKVLKYGVNIGQVIVEEYLRSMQAVGYLEGYLTCHEMNAWYVNFYSGLFDGGDPTDEALEFLEQNHNWMVTQSEENYLTSDYWLGVKGLLSQLDGIVAGAKEGCPGTEQRKSESVWDHSATTLRDPVNHHIYLPSLHKKPALIHLLLMNANGDLYQIAEKFQQRQQPVSSILDSLVDDDDYLIENGVRKQRDATGAGEATLKMAEGGVQEPIEPVGEEIREEIKQHHAQRRLFEASPLAPITPIGGAKQEAAKEAHPPILNPPIANPTVTEKPRPRAMPAQKVPGGKVYRPQVPPTLPTHSHMSDSLSVAASSATAPTKKDASSTPAQPATPYKGLFNLWGIFSSASAAKPSVTSPKDEAAEVLNALRNNPPVPVDKAAGGAGEGMYYTLKDHTSVRNTVNKNAKDKGQKKSRRLSAANMSPLSPDSPPTFHNGPYVNPSFPAPPSADQASRSLRVGPLPTSLPEHCSAIIKLPPDLSDIFFGHNTWDDFQCASPRVFKHIAYPRVQVSGGAGGVAHTESSANASDTSSSASVSSSGKKAKVQVRGMFDVFFSSSPGLLSSVDDFYIVMGEGELAVMETTIDVYRAELLEYIVPESMLSWGRARLANWLAPSGPLWVETFSYLHSGTYVNQWMVIDMTKFTPGSLPQPNFLTVLEEVPGYIHAQDMTDKLLTKSYWASYNSPYFSDISHFTGQDILCEQDSSMCYDTDIRAKLFTELQGGVNTLYDMRKVMGFNKFKEMPGLGACDAIACRMDQATDADSRYPFGAIDAKISSVLSASPRFNPHGVDVRNNFAAQSDVLGDTERIFSTRRPMVQARMGPTTDNLPPFCWADWDTPAHPGNASSASKYNPRGHKFFHVGHPACFDFQWQALPPMPSSNVQVN